MHECYNLDLILHDALGGIRKENWRYYQSDLPCFQIFMFLILCILFSHPFLLLSIFNSFFHFLLYPFSTHPRLISSLLIIFSSPAFFKSHISSSNFLYFSFFILLVTFTSALLFLLVSEFLFYIYHLFYYKILSFFSGLLYLFLSLLYFSLLLFSLFSYLNIYFFPSI